MFILLAPGVRSVWFIISKHEVMNDTTGLNYMKTAVMWGLHGIRPLINLLYGPINVDIYVNLLCLLLWRYFHIYYSLIILGASILGNNAFLCVHASWVHAPYIVISLSSVTRIMLWYYIQWYPSFWTTEIESNSISGYQSTPDTEAVQILKQSRHWVSGY